MCCLFAKDKEFANTEPCERDPSKYAVRGIEIYLSQMCASLSLSDELHAKFGFFDLSSAQKREIREYYFSKVKPSMKEDVVESIVKEFQDVR